MIGWKNQSVYMYVSLCVSLYVNPEGKNKKNGWQPHFDEIITGNFLEHLKSVSPYIQWECNWVEPNVAFPGQAPSPCPLL